MEQTCHPLDRVSDRRHAEFTCFFPAQLTAEIDIPIFYDLKCIASRFVAAKDTHGPVRLSSAFFPFIPGVRYFFRSHRIVQNGD
jgi:hypothetical protein